MKKDLKLTKARNYGVGGTRIARHLTPSEETLRDLDFNVRASIMVNEDADYVFVFGGTNDYGFGDTPLGTISDTADYTFYGALKMLYQKLIEKYSKDNIIVLTPMHRVRENGEDSKDQAKRQPLSAFVYAIKDVASMFGLKVIDLYSIEELNPNNKKYKKYFKDGLHPNDKGHILLAKIIERELELL